MLHVSFPPHLAPCIVRPSPLSSCTNFCTSTRNLNTQYYSSQTHSLSLSLSHKIFLTILTFLTNFQILFFLFCRLLHTSFILPPSSHYTKQSFGLRDPCLTHALLLHHTHFFLIVIKSNLEIDPLKNIHNISPLSLITYISPILCSQTNKASEFEAPWHIRGLQVSGRRFPMERPLYCLVSYYDTCWRSV